MPGELGAGTPPPGHVGAVCPGEALARPPQVSPVLIRRVPPPPPGVCRARACALPLDVTCGCGEGLALLSPCSLVLTAALNFLGSYWPEADEQTSSCPSHSQEDAPWGPPELRPPGT